MQSFIKCKKWEVKGSGRRYVFIEEMEGDNFILNLGYIFATPIVRQSLREYYKRMESDLFVIDWWFFLLPWWWFCFCVEQDIKES